MAALRISGRRGPGEGEFSDLGIHHHQFKDAESTAVAAFSTMRTALPLHKGGRGRLFGGDASRFELALGGGEGMFALGANHTHQPLGQNADDTSRHQVGRYTHVDHAGDRPGGVVGVQCAKYQVTGERRLNAHRGGLVVTHFADQDHVGCLTQHRANNQREVQADLVPDFYLVDPRQIVLDRVFGGNDLAVGSIEFVECRVERGRLAGTGRAGHEQNAVGTANEAAKLAEVGLGEAQLADADLDVVFVQQPHDAGLAVRGRQHAHAEVEFFATGGDLDPSVLGAATFGNVHPGQNLNTREQGSQADAEEDCRVPPAHRRCGSECGPDLQTVRREYPRHATARLR